MTELCHTIELRVYWEDTDAGGVVFYANYLKYLERARTEWLRACGVEQRALQEAQDCLFVVADVRLRYVAPARLDDWLRVSAQPLEWGRASLLLQQQVWRGERLLLQGQVRVACVQASSLRPCRIPAAILERLAPAPAAAQAAPEGDPA